MHELIGGNLGWVALKAILLYLTAILGLRLGERRTLAEMSAFDFVAAVAVGAIIGRVPNSSSTSYAQGAITLIAVLIAHRIISRLRKFQPVSLLVDHPPRVLVCRGEIVQQNLRRTGITRNDLFGILRQRGVVSLADVHLAVFEQRGKISIVKNSDMRDGTSESELVTDILHKSNDC